MLLIPTIHLKDGQCVDPQKPERVLARDPGALVAEWAQAGLARIQVNDLDAQGDGSAVSAALIGDIAGQSPDLTIQVGGGVREEDAVQAYLEAGAHYVVIGMRALSAPHLLRDLCLEYPGHILAELQSREGRIDTDGWSKLANQDAIELAQHFERDGVEAIIFHDAGGKADSLNLDSARRFAQELTIPVFAAGPASAWRELEGLMAAEEDGLSGAVLSEWASQADFDLTSALKLAGSGD